MQIDATTTVTGGELYSLDLEVLDLTLTLDPAPLLLVAKARPTTVSISHLFIDSGDPGAGPDPDPDPDATLYFGVPSQHFGMGGAPPYIDGYPLSGAFFNFVQDPPTN